MKILYYIYLTISLLLSSCVSIERDIYFKNRESKDGKTIGSIRPGSNFQSSPIKVSGQHDREVYMSIPNYAEGSYLWGVIIPIVPVFFLPQMKFSLDINESLKVRCHIGAHYGPQYLKKWEHAGSRDLYVLSKEGEELSEKVKKLGKDTCSSAIVLLPNGQSIQPVKTESEDNSKITVFTFDISEASLSEFSIIINQVQLYTGEKIKTDIKFNAILEDWTRYYMVQIAP